jgi:peptidyl-prolyl cis-trans isomerase D
MVERRPYKANVGGSIPSAPTTGIKANHEFAFVRIQGIRRMSMFDIVRNNKKITQVFLAVITLPFAFWGVESYVRNVDSGSRSRHRWRRQDQPAGIAGGACANSRSAPARPTGRQVDPGLVRVAADAPRRARFADHPAPAGRTGAQRRRWRWATSSCAQFIATVPSLQENGKFSKERYEAVVAGQGMSKEMFEARLRQDLAMQQLTCCRSARPASPARPPQDRWLATQLEQREVQ